MMMRAGGARTVIVSLALAGCGGLAAASKSAEGAHDPCALLTAGEALPYVGALVAPPYRASDGAADVRGDECMYRGTDGREVAVRPDWQGGHLAGRAVDEFAKGIAGPWDRAIWTAGRALVASNGDGQVAIDVSGASGEERDALALARIMVPRLAKPLDYDGAAAVALAPKPRPHPAHACDLVPRADVEAAIGPLDGEPASDAPETSCTYRVVTARGERAYPVEFTWDGGQKRYRMLERGMAAASGDTVLAGPWDHAALFHGTRLIGVRHDTSVGMNLQSADYAKAKALLAAICSRL
jgi:hypothetical protein